MKVSKNKVIYVIIVVVIAYFLASYKLPYYIQRPGGADELDPIVEVENGFESKGEMHLVTVSGMQATPVQYILAKILPHNEIMPIEDAFPHGVSQDDYMEAQLQVMENSQEAATVVAYTEADADIQIEYDGVYVVSVLPDMPADGKLNTGDKIIGIDGRTITDANDLIEYVETKEKEESITLEFVRDEETLTTEITLDIIDEDQGKIGIGISLVTDRSVQVSPDIEFTSGRIGGPSAGLMFSLEIYDQLTEEDITKGYQIAGTGEIDYDGNVYRIGGIDKKIIAADKKGIDIFFAPSENGRPDSNYQEALEVAKEIDSDMEIVPVDTFKDALEYLKNLE